MGRWLKTVKSLLGICLVVAIFTIVWAVHLQKGQYVTGLVSQIKVWTNWTKVTSEQQRYFIPETANDSQFTVVMLTHNRTDVMLKTMQNYSKMKTIHKIILLWNNIGTPVPKIGEMVNLSMPLVVKPWTENKLRFRFLPLPEIETQGVFSTDDDLIVNNSDVERAFNSWKKRANGITGFTPRGYRQTPSGHYEYIWSLGKNDATTMMLTGAAFLHREYLRMFTETLPQEAAQLIDTLTNCEDIAMNFVVSDFCKCVPSQNVKISRRAIRHLTLKVGLSNRRGHLEQRHECMNVFVKAYKYMPLNTTRS